MRSFTKRVTFGGKTTPFWCSFVPCPVKAWTCRHMTALNTEQLGLALYEVVVKFHKYLDFIVGFGREYGSEICKQSFLYILPSWSTLLSTLQWTKMRMYLSPRTSQHRGRPGPLGPSVTSCRDAQTWRQIQSTVMQISQDQQPHLKECGLQHQCSTLFPILSGLQKYTRTPWLTQILLTQISLTHNLKRFLFLI